MIRHDNNFEFDHLNDQLPYGICVIDNDYQVLYWNHCLETWTGIKRKTILNTSLVDHFPHFGEANYRLRMDSVFSGGPPVVFSFQFHKHLFPAPLENGQMRMLHTQVSPLKHDKDTLALLSVEDVTDLQRRIHNEDVLKLNRIDPPGNSSFFLDQDEVQSLLHNSPDFIMNVDRDGIIRYVNRPMPGTTLTDVLGKPFYEFTDMEYHTIFGETIAKVFQTGQPDSLITSGIRSDQSTAWYEIRFGPVGGASGQVVSVMLIVTDITVRKRAEEEFRNNERRYRLLAENVTDFIWTIDENLRFLYVSPSIQSLLGYTVEEAFQMSWTDVVAPGSLDVVTETLAELPKLQKEAGRFPYLILEIEMECQDKKRVITETKLSFLRNDQDQPIGILGSTRDITLRKKTEMKLNRTLDELKRSNAELEQFAYVASHDLQEPLRMISSYLQLLSRRYQDRLDGDADEFIQYAVDGSQRMQNMIKELLAFSRVSTRGRPFRETDMNSVMQKVKNNLKIAIAESRTELVIPEMPLILADEMQMIQLFQNLISNAIKFRSDQPPLIRITVEEKEAEWAFTVDDNGIGIDMEYKERIFIIFQRLHTRDEYEGTGIGLSICKKIVERHGGEIGFESEGRGTRFYFTLARNPALSVMPEEDVSA